MKSKAVFVDRDGVINDLVYSEEEGRIASPVSARQLRVFPYVAKAMKSIHGLGFKVIVVSNQPGVAKRQFTLAEHERMSAKVRKVLASEGATLDGEYYCLHHPDALLARYRVDCDCRKPKPGLLLRAAEEKNLDLAKSYFVGDGLIDVKAGKKAGCKTVLAGHVTTFLTRMMKEEDATPDFVVHTLRSVPELLKKQKRT